MIKDSVHPVHTSSNSGDHQVSYLQLTQGRCEQPDSRRELKCNIEAIHQNAKLSHLAYSPTATSNFSAESAVPQLLTVLSPCDTARAARMLLARKWSTKMGHSWIPQQIPGAMVWDVEFLGHVGNRAIAAHQHLPNDIFLESLGVLPRIHCFSPERRQRSAWL